MPLLIEEITPGIVAILEPALLLENPEVSSPTDAVPFRKGPFLCVQSQGGQSAWLHLTKNSRDGQRLEVRAEWRLDGSDRWRNVAQYVSDARSSYRGPNTAFVAAGAMELPHRPHLRPRVDTDGVMAVIAEMKRYGAQGI